MIDVLTAACELFHELLAEPEGSIPRSATPQDEIATLVREIEIDIQGLEKVELDTEDMAIKLYGANYMKTKPRPETVPQFCRRIRRLIALAAPALPGETP